jgi:GH25 family lysozyme M1 (1,4-beta-N-acetylmuramidase)
VQRKWEGTDAVLGIDVSKWQKDIDWQAVAGDGIDFAIIRCGYRGSSGGALVEDPYFRKNLEGAKAAGLKTGVYFFTQAVNEVEAVEEASMVVELLNGASLDMPVFIDTEGSGGRADLINRDMRTAVCKAFCETINNAGYRSGIYASRSWYYNKLKDGELSQYTHWVAEYRKNPLYKDDFALWQYTSKGAVNGINTKVDMDLVWSGN